MPAPALALYKIEYSIRTVETKPALIASYNVTSDTVVNAILKASALHNPTENEFVSSAERLGWIDL